MKLSIKKYRVLLFLIAILLPYLEFNGTTSLPFQEETTNHKSVAWGFKCTPLVGSIPSYFHLESFNTYDTAKKASKLLGQYGYTTDLQLNPTDPNVIKSSFQNAEVFFFIGHGASSSIGLQNDKCDFEVYFTKDYLNNYVESHNLKFVLLSACSTGKDYDNPDNILHAFKDTGASKVIGFNRSISQTPMRFWTERFWKYALEEKMETGDAARRASNDIERMFWIGRKTSWLTTDSLAIKGTDDVYLGYEQEFPGLSQEWEQILQDLRSFIQDKFQQKIGQLNTNLTDWFEKQWLLIQKSFEEWIQKELWLLLEKLLNELIRIMIENCLQPIAIVFVIGRIIVYQNRKNL